MKPCGIRASVIDHLDHAAKHLLVAVTTILRYESGYAAHHVTKTFAATTLYCCIMVRLYLLEARNFVRQRGDRTGYRHPGAEARK